MKRRISGSSIIVAFPAFLAVNSPSATASLNSGAGRARYFWNFSIGTDTGSNITTTCVCGGALSESSFCIVRLRASNRIRWNLEFKPKAAELYERTGKLYRSHRRSEMALFFTRSLRRFRNFLRSRAASEPVLSPTPALLIAALIAAPSEIFCVACIFIA